tara:strand:+ start:1507 stop:3366 length:1860 start_codon:yes stop_codon:yes gene_type:complete
MAKIATAVVETKVVGTDQVQRGLKNVDNAMHRTANTSKAVNNQLRLMRGGFGQVGHQVQDVAVQLQMGQNALLVFGQQGGQIASLFGSKGAVIGAILAVSAALAMTLAPNLFVVRDRMKEMIKESEESAESFNKLTGAAKEFAKTKLEEQLEAERKVLAKANEQVEERRRRVEQADGVIIAFTESEDAYNKRVAEGRVLQQKANAEIERLQKILEGVDPTFNKFIENQKKEIEQLGLTERELDILAVKRLNMSDALEKEALANVKLLHDEKDRLEGIKEAQNVEKNREETVKRFVDQLELQIAKIGATKKQIDEYTISQMNLNDAEKEQIMNLLNLREQKQKNQDIDEDKEKLNNKQIETFDRLNKQLDEQLVKFRKGEQALDNFKISQMNLTDEQKKALLTKQQLIHGYEEEEQKIKDNADAAEKALKELEKQQDQFRDAYMPLFNEFGDGFADAITGAQNFAEAMKGVAKSVIDSLIRMAIQKMIIDQLFSGFMNMFAPQQQTTSLGSALSQASKAGYGIEGFEGGGFTGYGSRSGGLDGRGGFMAMLHPNETVVDHTKGSGGGVVIQQTINVTTGVQQTVRAEIATLMPQIAQATKAAVADARMRGGNFSKSMVGA